MLSQRFAPMTKHLAAILACTAAIALASPAQAGLVRAFDHQLTWNCADKKTEWPDGKTRYRLLDLALLTVSAKYDPKDELTFKERAAGKKPPVVTRAMLEQRQAIATAEFDKVLAECQAQHHWTDEERGYIREYSIARTGLSRSTYALFSPDDDVLFNQYDHHMSQEDFQALADGKFPGSALHKAAIADLKASDWYKGTRKYMSLDDPYYQGLVADAYYTHLIEEVMHARFDESAEKRFPK